MYNILVGLVSNMHDGTMEPFDEMRSHNYDPFTEQHHQQEVDYDMYGLSPDKIISYFGDIQSFITQLESFMESHYSTDPAYSNNDNNYNKSSKKRPKPEKRKKSAETRKKYLTILKYKRIIYLIY